MLQIFESIHVMFNRNPANPYDENCIEVRRATDNVHVGHIKKEHAFGISKVMDQDLCSLSG